MFLKPQDVEKVNKPTDQPTRRRGKGKGTSKKEKGSEGIYVAVVPRV